MKRLLSIAVAVLLLVTAVVSVGAATTEDFMISNDGTQFCYNGEVYRHVTLPYSDVVEPYDMELITTKYQPDADGYEWDVEFYHNPEIEGLIVAVGYHDTYCSVFVTEDGEALIDDYLNGKYSHWWLWTADHDTLYFSELPDTLILALQASENETLTVDASELEALTSLDIIGLDASQTVRHTHGAIYVMDDGYYYLNYDALQNNMFSSDGYFSYRGGDVELIRLDDAEAAQIDTATGNKQAWDVNYGYSGNLELDWSLPEGASLVIFIVIATILGFVLPLVPLVLGLIVARSPKTKNPHGWYLLAGLAALWILCVAILLVLITTV